MSLKLEKGDNYGVEEIEANFKDLKLIYKVGKGSWTDHLYFVPSLGVYLEKGAFGDHDTVCFKLSDVTNEQGAENWKKEVVQYWKNQFPDIDID